MEPLASSIKSGEERLKQVNDEASRITKGRDLEAAKLSKVKEADAAKSKKTAEKTSESWKSQPSFFSLPFFTGIKSPPPLINTLSFCLAFLGEQPRCLGMMGR